MGDAAEALMDIAHDPESIADYEDSLDEFQDSRKDPPTPHMTNFLEEPDTMAEEIAAIKAPLAHEPPDPFSLDAVVEEPEPAPLRIVLYGPHGIGKTTFASRMPAPITLFTEDGKRNLRIPRFPKKAETYAEVIRAMQSLLSKPHTHQTFVFDTLDWFEKIVWDEMLRRFNISEAEAKKYGTGYGLADQVWSEFFGWLDALHDSGLHVLLNAHSEVAKFSPPESEGYDRYDLALHKRIRPMVHEWADVVAFAYEKTYTKTVTEGSGSWAKTTVKGGGSAGRMLALQRQTTFEAKNGYGLPAEVPFDASTPGWLLQTIYESFAPAAA